ncbi:signal peptidase I [Lachnospiraceae bacterium KH1T2]|nr:signal peptidase I [Lachnospiraceae bacterium KH1T2]
MKKFFHFSIYILVVLIITIIVKNFCFQRSVVDGASMENTLQNGESLIVDKISCRFTGYKRFDVVIFPFRYSKDVYYIKRIIGLPGETVQIAAGKIYINGTELKENYGKEPIVDAGNASTPVTLGKDEYFVLGDNRNSSMDSRMDDVGNVQKKELIGRVALRIWPLNKFGSVK